MINENVKEIYIGIIKRKNEYSIAYHSIWSNIKGYCPVYRKLNDGRIIFYYVLKKHGLIDHQDKYREIVDAQRR